MLIYPTILKLGRNHSGLKRPRAETTHLPRPKRPSPKTGRNDPAETTQGRNDPEPEWPTESLYRSTKPSRSLQNLLLSGFLHLQSPSIAWNKQNSADLVTLHCVHHWYRTLNFYLVLLYTVPKQCDVNSSLVPTDLKIGVTCRPRKAKIVPIGNPRWQPY